MRFCIRRVKPNRNGSSAARISARPRFWNQITARMLTMRHASANMLTTPPVNRFSTVSTSPTNRETSAPGSCRFSESALSRVNFAISRLRSAWVIFCPNTISPLSRRDSIAPASASSAK